MSRRLLLIGCTSKIAHTFITRANGQYELYGVCRKKADAPDGIDRIFEVDLSNPESVTHLLHLLKDVYFDGVLFFASTYLPDVEGAEAFAKQLQTTLQINTVSVLSIAKGIRYNPNATVILFGDASLDRPKAGFSAYSLSKVALERATKQLAVDLHEVAKVLCFRLGPVSPRENHPDKDAYYAKNIFRVQQPESGLVNLLLFTISEPNLGMTGAIIDYDGGTYLRR